MQDDGFNILTRVGPGTPMGNLFRRFWLPALLSSELPEPDGTPVRLRILSDRRGETHGPRVGCGLLRSIRYHPGLPVGRSLVASFVANAASTGFGLALYALDIA